MTTKITKKHLRNLIIESSGGYRLSQGPWDVMWQQMSNNPDYEHLMKPENKESFKKAWDRAASDYNLTADRVAREMISIDALKNLTSMGLGPKSRGGEMRALDLDGDGQLTITVSEMKRIIKEELRKTLKEDDDTDVTVTQRHTEDIAALALQVMIQLNIERADPGWKTKGLETVLKLRDKLLDYKDRIGDARLDPLTKEKIITYVAGRDGDEWSTEKYGLSYQEVEAEWDAIKASLAAE
jgi:hypothetical protein